MSIAARSVFDLLGTTPEKWLALPRTGARAGRGFHFQDAALTLLLVRGLLGTARLGLLVPEGRDDATLDLDDLQCDAQVKSRQPHQPDFRATEMAKIVVDLADRRGAERLLVMLERGFPATDLHRRAADQDRVREQLAPALARRCGGERAEQLLERLSIVIVSDPLDAAATELAGARDLHPEVAALVARSLCAAVAACVDRNAEHGEPGALTITDAASIVDRTVELIDVAALDAALARGLCEAVEFPRSRATEEYLRGAATTPAHVASGLVLDRPAAVDAIRAEILARRRVLIPGPSGSGKSALVWLTVHQTRHTIRWYRIRRLDEADAAAAVDRLARVLGASPDRPVGFVVDDVGRLGAARWDALVSEFVPRPGVMLLGAVREDDLSDIATLTDVALIRAAADEGFAEALWRTLLDHGETNWAGWREPFERAEGLVLEYVNILTRGARLDELLAGQVKRLAGAHGEQLISVLTYAAVSDQLGITVTIEQLTRLTGQDRAAVTAAARRLQDEFLVQVDGQSVGGLHELRSMVTGRHALRVEYRGLDEVVTALLRIIEADELLVAVPRASKLMVLDSVVAALASRFTAQVDVSELTACLEGLRGIELQISATEVAETMHSSLSPGDILDVVQMRFGANLHDSVRMLWDAPEIPAPTTKLRQQLLTCFASASPTVASAGEATNFIIALPPEVTPSWLVQALAGGLTFESFEDVVGLLDAARGHGREVHEAAVVGLGGPAAAACATSAALDFDVGRFDPVGPTPRVRCLARDDGPFWDVKLADGELVARILACSPQFEQVQVDVVDATGRAISPMTTLPAIDRPVSAEPFSVVAGKERHRAAILAGVGSSQWTSRLAAEERLLRPLAAALEFYRQCVCRGIPVSKAAPRFASLERAAASLTPPPATVGLEDSTAGGHLVGARHEADPFTALLRHPDWFMLDPRGDAMHAAVVAYRLSRVAGDLRDDGRWGLLPEDTEEVVDRVVATLADLRLLLAERALTSDGEWSAMVAGARLRPKTRDDEVLNRAGRSAERRGRTEARAFERSLHEADISARVDVVAEPNAPGAVWPPTRLVVTVALPNAKLWPETVEKVMRARLAVSDQRAVTVLVQLDGEVSGCLSGEAARAWWPRSDVLAAAGAVGRPEPRGIAWRSSLRAAARVHSARTWREATKEVTSLTELLTAALKAAERDAAEARSVLETYALDDAIPLFDAICDGSTDEDAHSRATTITAALAGIDATGGGQLSIAQQR